MVVDLTKLLTNQVSSINIDESVSIPSSFLENSLIDKLTNVKIKANIKYNEDDCLMVNGLLTGTMLLKDDITLEPVEYNFSTEIEENLEKSENILDITDILWQNILVEIPSKVRTAYEDIELSGNGWRVISKEKYKSLREEYDNPFTNLEKLLKEKEDK